MLTGFDLLIAYFIGGIISVVINPGALANLSPRDVDWEDAPTVVRKPDDWSSEISF